VHGQRRKGRNVTRVDGGPISVIARQMYGIRDEFIDELFQVMKGEIGGLNHDTGMMDMWRAGLTENVLAGIHYLQLDEPPASLEAPAAALIYARVSAQRDVPLSALVRAHRIGHARFLAVAMEYVSLLEPAQQVPTLIELVNRSAHFVDLVADQLTMAYEQEHDRLVSRTSGLQQQWVNEVLAGVPVDVKRAERVLGYRLDGVHIAAVVWPDAAVPTRDVVALFDQVRSLVAAEVGAVGRPLMVPTDEREARMWFSPASARKQGALEPSRVRAAFKSAGIPAGVAFGRVEDGLRGFRASLNQAERVKAVVLAGEGGPGAQVVFYNEVAPIAWMATDVDELRRFVSDVLGDLSVDDERNGWLRETLREFLARNRSYVATADAMILHRNTIQYRVAQAMELCGQNVDDPDAVFKVQIALEVCRWMAPAVLRTAHQRGPE
jgi:DNA-binding PucR family transcriptional regulator